MKTAILYKKNLWMILFWGWSIIVVILTSMPTNPKIIEQDEVFLIRLDYLEHIFFFTVQSFLFFFAYPLYQVKKGKIKLLFWLLAGIFFASITEIYQYFIPGRTFNFIDLALNNSGILLGIPAGRLFFSLIPDFKS